ncbi:hypothetical protein [Micromonospora sp. SH-82]|uniref:hypothetical protein n=1 Tax=Micromonospora sp. SH-82 TaxID=3132938 RepID=UPI003EB8984C
MTEQAAALSRGTLADSSEKFLRLALKLDAVVTGLNGLAYLVAAPLLGDLFDMSTGLLRGIGIFLTVFAAAVWVVGTRPVVSSAGATAVVVVNAVWVVASLVAAVVGLDGASTIARVWMVMQAAVVGLFAVLQIVGLRRQRP